MTSEVGHVQYRVKCRSCGLHFTIHTWHPEIHSARTLYCPECGHHGGRFVVWALEVPTPIFEWVPGAAELVSVAA